MRKKTLFEALSSGTNETPRSVVTEMDPLADQCAKDVAPESKESDKSFTVLVSSDISHEIARRTIDTSDFASSVNGGHRLSLTSKSGLLLGLASAIGVSAYLSGCRTRQTL